jgi:hypothetical protein
MLRQGKRVVVHREQREHNRYLQVRVIDQTAGL